MCAAAALCCHTCRFHAATGWEEPCRLSEGLVADGMAPPRRLLRSFTRALPASPRRICRRSCARCTRYVPPQSMRAVAATESRLVRFLWLWGRRVHLSCGRQHSGRSICMRWMSFARWHALRCDGCLWSFASASTALFASTGAGPQLLPAVRLQGRLRWRPEHWLWHDLRQSGGRQEVRAQVPPDAGARRRHACSPHGQLPATGRDGCYRPRASGWLHAGLQMWC